jgi:hypothetical protein
MSRGREAQVSDVVGGTPIWLGECLEPFIHTPHAEEDGVEEMPPAGCNP